MSRSSWYREMSRLASSYHGRVVHTKAGHLTFEIPGVSSKIFTSGTPSDYRALQNVKARLRRSCINHQKKAS